MLLIHDSHDSLPYVDADVTAEERALANYQIERELPSGYSSIIHPSLPPLPEFRFSALIHRELARKAAGLPMEGGVDTSRYEAMEPPPTDPTSDEDRPAVTETWRETLRKAYAASTHLQSRLTNLALLEKFGKNAWLMGNAQLEDILRGMEKELVHLRDRTDETNKARKGGQEHIRGELDALNESWREGIGKVIEAEAASEALRQAILQRRREMSKVT
ncbi:MAG: hypothetical protein M1816_007710 [Peltula sp. TS41687]|nr:MAG: hypothetical protein M1816_007710 [Peltula sp. TS41687]